MWFKQIQLFQLTSNIPTPEQLEEQLLALAFTPCLPSFPSSMGWISPVENSHEEDAKFIRTINGNIMLCLQFEEKILPATVIRQELIDKIKEIEKSQARKVRQKEKLSLKDEITHTLLPQAFSRLSQVYAYIDTKNSWLVLGTTNASKTEQFISFFKRSVTENVHPYELKKLAPIITQWLISNPHFDAFSIEKSCMLQDPNQQNRIIRCQQQDLFAGSIQSLIKDGCEVKQLAMNWQDRINFVLADDFSLRSLQYHEELISQAKDAEAETKVQQFDADFFIMTESVNHMLKDLLGLFISPEEMPQKMIQPEAVTAE